MVEVTEEQGSGDRRFVCGGGGGDGKEELLLLESSQASPALPSHKSSIEMKV